MVGAREACKSFPNTKLYEVGGNDLAEYLSHFAEIAGLNGIQLDQSDTDVFKYVIYSKLNDSIRRWLGDRFFSVDNVKDLINILKEFGNAPLEQYQVYCPSCLRTGNFICASENCKPQNSLDKLSTISSSQTVANEAPIKNGDDSISIKKNSMDVFNSSEQVKLDQPFPRRSSSNGMHSKSDTRYDEDTTEFPVAMYSEYDWTKSTEMFTSTQPDVFKIVQAARNGKCYDCGQTWVHNHICEQRNRDQQSLKCMDCKMPQTAEHLCPIWRYREQKEFFQQDFAYEMALSAMVFECFDCQTSLENHFCRNRRPVNNRKVEKCPLCKLLYRPRHYCMIKHYEKLLREYPVRKILILTAFNGKCFDCKQEFNEDHTCANRIRDEELRICPDCKLPNLEKYHRHCPVITTRVFGTRYRAGKPNLHSNQVKHRKNYSSFPSDASSSLKRKADSANRGISNARSMSNADLSNIPVSASDLALTRSKSADSTRALITDISTLRPSAETLHTPPFKNSGHAYPHREQPGASRRLPTSANATKSSKLDLDEFGNIIIVSANSSEREKSSSPYCSPDTSPQSSVRRRSSSPYHSNRERSSSPDISLAEMVYKRPKLDSVGETVKDPPKLSSLLESARECKCWDCGADWKARHSCPQRERDRRSGICVHCKLGLVRGKSHECKVLEVLQDSIRHRELLLEKDVEKGKLEYEERKGKYEVAVAEKIGSDMRRILNNRNMEKATINLQEANVISNICDMCPNDLTDSGSDVSLTPEEDFYPID